MPAVNAIEVADRHGGGRLGSAVGQFGQHLHRMGRVQQ
jgi:hypothetical protein